MTVLDIRAGSLPHKFTVSLVNRSQHAHAVVEEGVGFSVIYEVETNFLVETGWKMVLDFEEEPLDVSLCVDIVLENQIVLTVSNTDHCRKISRFKP